MAYPITSQITSSSCPIQVLINPPMNAPSGFYYPALYVGISTTANGPVFEFASYIYYIVLT